MQINSFFFILKLFPLFNVRQEKIQSISKEKEYTVVTATPRDIHQQDEIQIVFDVMSKNICNFFENMRAKRKKKSV